MIKLYDTFKVDLVRQDILDSLKTRLENEQKYWDPKPEKEYNSLWEIYYYIVCGLYSRAWQQISKLNEANRWKIPANVYHFLDGFNDCISSIEHKTT